MEKKETEVGKVSGNARNVNQTFVFFKKMFISSFK
jgi:hypothetical protein